MELISYSCNVFCFLMAILGFYLTAASIGSFLRRRPLPPSSHQLRFAVLVPARNEAGCISGIIESIQQQHYPPELVDIYVIPNNCTDDTAGVATAAGAQTIHVSPAVRSKGQALHEAFDLLLHTQKHDAYCIFDADNEACPEFLAEINRALVSGARAAKSRIFAKNAHESWVCACYEIFFCNANRFLNLARSNLGLSARVIGTGIAVRRDLIEELGGWNTETMTEDAEFFAILAARGERTAFVPGAVTYDEEPLTFQESLIQRRRWMSGIMGVGRLKFPQLFCACFASPNKRFALDALLQFSFTILQAWVIPCFLLRLCTQPAVTMQTLPSIAVSFYIGSFLTGGAALFLEKRLTKCTFIALFLYPLFVFSFLLLQTAALFCPNKVWTPIHHTGVRLSYVSSASL